MQFLKLDPKFWETNKKAMNITTEKCYVVVFKRKSHILFPIKANRSHRNNMIVGTQR
jgi:hypothetical protein